MRIIQAQSSGLQRLEQSGAWDENERGIPEVITFTQSDANLPLYLLMHPPFSDDDPLLKAIDPLFQGGHQVILFLDLYGLQEFFRQQIHSQIIAIFLTKDCGGSTIRQRSWRVVSEIMTDKFPAEEYILGGEELRLSDDGRQLKGCLSKIINLRRYIQNLSLDPGICGVNLYEDSLSILAELPDGEREAFRRKIGRIYR